MGAVGGIWSLGGREPKPALLRMADVLAHRGGGGRGFSCAGGLGLYQEASFGLQGAPAWEEALVFDGRIDNREELLRELDLPPEASTHSVVAAAYGRWGRECPQHLQGEFVLALWDARQEALFLARDRFGVRPLYYFWESGTDGLFAFASEIKGLFAIPGIPCRPRESAIVDFVAGMGPEGVETPYEGIARLPAGHWMEVRRSGPRIERYWSLALASIEGGGDADLAEELHRRLSRAVARRLRPGVRSGIFLSGGIDSSSIAGILREHLAKEEGPEAIAAVFPTIPECDESRFIRGVVDFQDLRLHPVRADLLDPLAEIEQWLYRQDGLCLGYNLFLNVALYREAAGCGARVVFDGFDGDTVVSHGVERLVELAQGGRWRALAREAALLASGHGFSAWDVWQAHVLRPLLPIPIRLARLRLQLARERGLPLLLRRELARKHGLAERIFASQRSNLADGRSVSRMHRLQLESPVIAMIFEAVDKEAAWWGIEPAHPFFDPEVVEWCLALPSDQKLRDGLTRYALRGAVRQSVPEMVRLRRDKSDQSQALTQLVHRKNQVQLQALLQEDRRLLEPYLEWEELEKIWRRYQATPNPADVMALWRAKVLACWLRGLESGRGWMVRPARG